MKKKIKKKRDLNSVMFNISAVHIIFSITLDTSDSFLRTGYINYLKILIISYKLL